MNKHLESLHVGEVVAMTESTNLFESLLHGKMKSKVHRLVAFWIHYEKTISHLFSHFVAFNIIQLISSV